MATESCQRFGLTGLVAMVATILLAALLTMHMHVALGIDAAAEGPLPVPTLWVILLLVGVNALVARLRSGRGLLNRTQLVLVAVGALMAAPLFSQGFWMRFVGTVTSYPRSNQFWVIDALPDKLWPHGANLLAGQAAEAQTVSQGHPLALRVSVGEGSAVPAAPHLVSALLKAEELPDSSALVCTVVGDGAPIEVFRLDRPGKGDQVRGDGFQRLGLYGLRLPEAQREVQVVFTLDGPGRVLVRDPKLMSVAAVETVLRGARPVTAEVMAQLPPEQRANSVILPAELLSVAGARFVASGGVAWGEWITCLLAWGGFLVLIMGACLGITLLMHRHWLEAERLPLPLGRATGMLLGVDPHNLWRSPWFWGALATAGAWCQVRYWAAFNPSIPDPSVAVALKPYFSDPSWGRMWESTFTIHALFLGLALFFELNVLASLVLGYWLYRSMFWIGDATGVASGNPDFPWRYDLCAGAFATYFVIILAMARRHLAATGRRALAGWSREAGEPVPPRAALALLIGCCLGSLAWAWWVGVGVFGFAILFAAFIVIGTVAARLRAECGVLFGYFTPYSMAIVLGSFGGIPVFGPQAVLFGLLASMWMATCTMHIPGMQVDGSELARREGASPWAVLGVPLLAVVLGVVVGGWAFLTLGNGQGGDNLRFAWAFDSKLWYFLGFNNEVSTLGDHSKGSVYSFWGIGLGAGATAVVAVLRQLLAGFWFHPVGILLGPTHVMDAVWGSCLLALVLRFVVVRMAGAEAVRERLLPAGLGIFCAACLAYFVACIHGSLRLGGAGVDQLVRSIP
jgi:hypothetical protein